MTQVQVLVGVVGKLNIMGQQDSVLISHKEWNIQPFLKHRVQRELKPKHLAVSAETQPSALQQNKNILRRGVISYPDVYVA